MQTLAVGFSETVDGASVAPDQVRAVTTSGTELAIGLAVVADRILVSPPVGGWGSEAFVLELHQGLSAQSGTGLSTPLVIPFTPL